MDQGIQFSRRIGVGDREHVRSQMLSIGFLSRVHLRSQLIGAMSAADHLGMMLRAHINVALVDHREQTAIIDLFRQNSTHQLIEHTHINREQYETAQSTFDIVIRLSGLFHEVHAETIARGITDVWKSNGGRFLQGNFAKRTLEELRVKYPDFFEDTDPEYKEFTNEIPVP